MAAPTIIKTSSTVRLLSRLNPLAWYAIAYAGAAAVQKGIGFVLFLWLAHSLSVENYATFGLLFALQSGLSALAGAGIGESVIGLLKQHPSDAQRRKLFDSANTVFVLLGLVSMVLGAAVYALLIDDAAAHADDLLYVIVGGVLTALFTLQATLARLEERHLSSLALSFFAPLSGLAAGFVAFLWGHTVTSFYLGMAAGLAASWMVFRLLGVGFYGVTAKTQDIAPILASVGPYIGIALLGWLSGYGSTYLVKSFFTASDVAKFTFAYTLSSVMHLVATSLNQVWSPRFFRLAHDLPLDQLEQRNRRFYALQGAALGAVGALVLAAVPVAINLAGGNLAAYRGMHVELFLLFAAYAVCIPWWHSQNYYLVHGKGKELMKVMLVTSVVGLGLWLLAMWTLGVVGVYLGFLVQMTVRMLGTVIWARRVWAIRALWEGAAIALLLLGAGSLAASSLADFKLS
jgi:O-antigen/teichoic acid export membrane protein